MTLKDDVTSWPLWSVIVKLILGAVVLSEINKQSYGMTECTECSHLMLFPSSILKDSGRARKIMNTIAKLNERAILRIQQREEVGLLPHGSMLDLIY